MKYNFKILFKMDAKQERCRFSWLCLCVRPRKQEWEVPPFYLITSCKDTLGSIKSLFQMPVFSELLQFFQCFPLGCGKWVTSVKMYLGGQGDVEKMGTEPLYSYSSQRGSPRLGHSVGVCLHLPQGTSYMGKRKFWGLFCWFGWVFFVFFFFF